MYHSVSAATQDRLTIAPDVFAAQMRYLSEQKFEVISLEAANRLLRDRGDLSRKIVLTFDDGYRDFLSEAAPVLLHYSFPATLFVVAGRCGETSTWGSIDRNRALLTVTEVDEVRRLGFTIGGHTMTHANLTALDDAGLERELRDAHAAMQRWDDGFCAFAYPGGQFGPRERAAVRQAGYGCAVIVGGRWGNGPETDLYRLKREPVLPSDDLAWFGHRVNGHYEWHFLWAQARGIRTR
jgi:peptidoglycan/xylan/chitin deacetylase (PgdA/CDA1 family)